MAFYFTYLGPELGKNEVKCFRNQFNPSLNPTNELLMNYNA